MRLFGRNVGQLHRRIPEYAWYFLKCFFLFERPVEFIRCYLSMRPPASKMVRFRSGLVIHLSDHPHDVLTIFVIFVRRDYGNWPRGGVVVDVGANIGVFALYAVHSQGAEKVLAYEPHSGTFACLQCNIEANGLGERISAFRFAVTGTSGASVTMSAAGSSPYNAVERDPSKAPGGESVSTIDLATIVCTSGPVDVLKLDCEGSEYEILFSADSDVYRRIDGVRMEYHGGVDELDRTLLGHGFVKMHETRGNVWYSRPHAAATRA
jgi:FkbM family methyltransferase